MLYLARLISLFTGQKTEEQPPVEKFIRNITSEYVNDVAAECTQRPIQNVTVIRPRWITPWGNYIGEIRKTAPLSATETKDGWIFYHPGFKGGKHEVTALASWQTSFRGNGFEILSER